MFLYLIIFMKNLNQEVALKYTLLIMLQLKMVQELYTMPLVLVKTITKLVVNIIYVIQINRYAQ